MKSAASNLDIQIKSRQRVRSLAEVYTHNREVTAILDTVGHLSSKIEAKVLEPTCGNGNFLVRILERKLLACSSSSNRRGVDRDVIQKDIEYQIVKSVCSIYGIDICHENVSESRTRLLASILDFYSLTLNTCRAKPSFWKTIEFVLSRNIICADALLDVSAIHIHEFSFPAMYKVGHRIFVYKDLMESERRPSPIFIDKVRNFWELGNE